MTTDQIYRRLDRIGDRLSDLELIGELTDEQRRRYEALEFEYNQLEETLKRSA